MLILWFIFVMILIVISILGYIEREAVEKWWKSMTPKSFQKGDTVFISDLILSPQYNNLVGVIASNLDSKKGRYAIKINYDDKFITVKPENLSFLTHQKQIESVLRNTGIHQRSKYASITPSDFIEMIASSKYRGRSLPTLRNLFKASFKNYAENADSVYFVIQYLSLYSSHCSL